MGAPNRVRCVAPTTMDESVALLIAASPSHRGGSLWSASAWPGSMPEPRARPPNPRTARSTGRRSARAPDSSGERRRDPRERDFRARADSLEQTPRPPLWDRAQAPFESDASGCPIVNRNSGRSRTSTRLIRLIFLPISDEYGRPPTREWCPGKDSNLHGLHRWYLKPVRLPIPPPGHGGFIRAAARPCQSQAPVLQF
jgi:hypothetical protein